MDHYIKYPVKFLEQTFQDGDASKVIKEEVRECEVNMKISNMEDYIKFIDADIDKLVLRIEKEGLPIEQIDDQVRGSKYSSACVKADASSNIDLANTIMTNSQKECEDFCNSASLKEKIIYLISSEYFPDLIHLSKFVFFRWMFNNEKENINCKCGEVF